MKLKAPNNRVIVKVDLEYKNSHKIIGENGKEIDIRLERQYDNFNLRYVKPVNAIVVDSKNIKVDSQILIHHNSTHDTYRIFNYQPPTKEASSSIKYYSIPEEECFLWKDNSTSTWNPLNNFATALRVFKPYNGILEGIEPTIIKNKLYITSGEFKDYVCGVLIASDYEIIFQGDDGREKNIIRLRHFEKEENPREEILFIDKELTQQVKNGELLVGITKKDAKKINN